MMIPVVIVSARRQSQQVERLVDYCKKLDGTVVQVLDFGEDTVDDRHLAAHLSFRKACDFFADTPFLWLEPDAIPRMPGWRERLIVEYLQSGKKFLLPSLEGLSQYDHASGIGIYPEGAGSIIPVEKPPDPYFAWDHWVYDKCRDDICFTRSIQHSYGAYGPNRALRRHHFPEDEAIIRPDALIFHSDPTQSLIDPAGRRPLKRHFDVAMVAAPVQQAKKVCGPCLVLGPKETLATPRNDKPIIVQLGRLGDIINLLPFAFKLSRQNGGMIDWLVSASHAHILTGVSYVKPIVWPGGPETLSQAITEAQSISSDVITTQVFKHPVRPRFDRYQEAQWALAGAHDEFGKWPLVFDRRNPEREAELADRWIQRRRSKTVLVSTRAFSGPFDRADELIAKIRGLDVDVVDLDQVQSEYPYDLLGLFDQADCLVTVDTMHLHLAQAAYCPVVSILNDGFDGSESIEQSIISFRYSTVKLDAVVESVKRIVEFPPVQTAAVILHTYKPDTERHKRAIATHPHGVVYFHPGHRPRMSEVFARGLEQEKDVVIFTNDDVTFKPDTVERILAHASKWPFGCSRRPRTPVHVGREIFWFRSDWLKGKIAQDMPDPYWSVQKPDLIMARFMRRYFGILTTMENLEFDFAPVEIPAGLIEHEDHPSHWANDEVEKSSEGQHNEKLWAMA